MTDRKLLLHLGAVLTMALLMSLAGIAVAADRNVEQRLTRLERLLESQRLVDMYVRLGELQKELQELRGAIEEQTHAMNGLKQRQRELYLDTDRRLRQIEHGGAAAPAAGTVAPPAAVPRPATAPRAAPPPTVATVATAEPEPTKADEEYRRAFELLKEGRYAEAIAQFGAYLKKYPGSGYADNAQYWLGEARYVTREFEPAVKEFEKVITNYPDSPKIADAMLKIGYCHYETKDYQQAKKVLTNLQKRYPDSTAARLAENRLQRMKLEGR